MKKRFLASLLATIFAISCAGCAGASQSNISFTTLEDGTRMLVRETGTTLFPDSLPADLDYNGKTITVTSVSAYQNRSSSSYSYNLYVVLALDVSALEDDEIHWLRESDLDISVYLTCENNEYDFDKMSLLGSLLLPDEKEILFVATSSFSEENRYPFSGAELHVVPTVEINETYEFSNNDGDINTFHKRNSLNYETILPEDIPDISEIDDLLFQYILKWLGNQAEIFANLFE